MKTDQEDIREILLHAQQALRLGDRFTARRWAERAVEIDRDSEDAWLTLAALASSRASINYYRQALKINPHSLQAEKGMQGVLDRLQGKQSKSIVGNEDTEPFIQNNIQPEEPDMLPQEIERPVPASIVLQPKPWGWYRWIILTLFLTAICVTAAWAISPVGAAPVMAFLQAPRTKLEFAGILNEVGKPSDTPIPTATHVPTSTSTPTPTSTFTPLPTDTITPTQTISQTDTLLPTDPPLPTDTKIPLPPNKPVSVASSSGDGVRWIDVSLSKQMLYAYEGNSIVKSFLVSTGVPEFPTVTGKYYIYIKFLFTDMHGEDYFLPNVPYTMYFYRSYGIHGTYWHHNFGHPMSHGCVNMYTPDAEWLYNWASVGTLVNIHY